MTLNTFIACIRYVYGSCVFRRPDETNRYSSSFNLYNINLAKGIIGREAKLSTFSSLTDFKVSGRMTSLNVSRVFVPYSIFLLYTNYSKLDFKFDLLQLDQDC